MVTEQRRLGAVEPDAVISPELARLEREIEAAFTVAGERFQRIRDARLYRDAYGSWDDYCERRWGLTGRSVNRQIEVAVAAKELPPGTRAPSQRELARERSAPLAEGHPEDFGPDTVVDGGGVDEAAFSSGPVVGPPPPSHSAPPIVPTRLELKLGDGTPHDSAPSPVLPIKTNPTYKQVFALLVVMNPEMVAATVDVPAARDLVHWAAAVESATVRRAAAAVGAKRAARVGGSGERPARGATDACNHPAEARTVLGYGTFCDRNKGGCGVKVR